MKNRLISIVPGILSGWLIVYVGELLLHGIFPPPSNINYEDYDALKLYMRDLPAYYFIGMLLIWSLSAYTGGMVTGKLAKANWRRACITTGLILMAGNIANFIMIPHPIWVNIAAVIMYLPLAYLGGKIVNKEYEPEVVQANASNS